MKKLLTPHVLENQSALELPDRQMLALSTVVVTNLLNNLDVEINVTRNNVAVQLCAAVELINAELFTVDTIDCEITQRQ
jgi:hypothetical protein